MSRIERNAKIREGVKRFQARGVGETGKNKYEIGKLQREHPGHVHEIISQAEASYFHHNPHATSSPEVYELAEGPYIQEAVESLGL